MNNIEGAKRETSKKLDHTESEIRRLRASQRLWYLWLAVGIVGVGLFGSAIGIWQSYPMQFSYAGLIIIVISTMVATRQIIKGRSHLDGQKSDLAELQGKEVELIVGSANDRVAALRIYRIAAQGDIERYRKAATRTRRLHKTFQVIIIIGSIAVTSLTSAGSSNEPLRWISAALAISVSIAAGFTGYFKYQERSFNLQQTADAIAEEAKAVDLRIGRYEKCDEEEALEKFAKEVEKIKKEQRKRELQIEQTDSPLFPYPPTAALRNPPDVRSDHSPPATDGDGVP